jgi:hypothetical protein
MTVAIILHLDIDDIFAVNTVAEDILEDLNGLGYDVISSKPWARDALAPATSSPLSGNAGTAPVI